MRRITLHMFTPVSVRRARACANSPVVTRQFAEVMMKRLLLLGTIGLLAACAESPTTPASVSVSAAVGRGNSSNAKLCQKNGWTGLVTSSGASFASEEACVSYAATGGQLYQTQTISFTSPNPSPVTVGASYTPTATATSGLPVAITLDGTSTSCVLTSGVVSFASVGTCVINANQAGNSVWYPAPQETQSITIAGATLVLEDVRVPPVGNWGRVTGSGLDPNADLYLCYTYEGNASCISLGPRTDDSGNLLYDAIRHCDPPFATALYVYTLRADGTTITSNTVDQTACPT